jgi:hypothetical protein
MHSLKERKRRFLSKDKTAPSHLMRRSCNIEKALISHIQTSIRKGPKEAVSSHYSIFSLVTKNKIIAVKRRIFLVTVPVGPDRDPFPHLRPSVTETVTRTTYLCDPTGFHALLTSTLNMETLCFSEINPQVYTLSECRKTQSGHSYMWTPQN